MERAIAIIHTCPQKIRQYIVFIGGTDQTIHRQTHLLRIESSQNIAEVSSRNHNIDLFSGVIHFTGSHKIAVGGEIIDNLRQQTSPIDGVGAGEHHPTLLQFSFDSRIGENTLDTGLSVVKIALNGAYRNVLSLLHLHLTLLHFADTVFGIKHKNFGSRHIAESFQRSLTGITGGRNQNHSRSVIPGLLEGTGQQMGQHLKRHIFKGTGWAMPQFQHIHIPIPVLLQSQRSRRIAGKLFRRIRSLRTLKKFFRRKLRQKIGQNLRRTLRIGGE